MQSTFYDILLVPPEADDELLLHAYEQSLAALVKKYRIARSRGKDTSMLESDRESLEEAWKVLSDPVRRSRYDRFLELAEESIIPQSADELWNMASSSMLSPDARHTVRLVELLTDLNTGISIEEKKVQSVQEEAKTEPGVPVWNKVSIEPFVPISQAEPVIEATPDPSSLASLVFELGYSGKLIKKVREQRGLSVEELAQATKITSHYIEEIEAEDFKQLPGRTFLRGYLKLIARKLELDAEALTSGYFTRMSRQ